MKEINLISKKAIWWMGGWMDGRMNEWMDRTEAIEMSINFHLTLCVCVWIIQGHWSDRTIILSANLVKKQDSSNDDDIQILIFCHTKNPARPTHLFLHHHHHHSSDWLSWEMKIDLSSRKVEEIIFRFCQQKRERDHIETHNQDTSQCAISDHHHHNQDGTKSPDVDT